MNITEMCCVHLILAGFFCFFSRVFPTHTDHCHCFFCFSDDVVVLPADATEIPAKSKVSLFEIGQLRYVMV